MGFFTEHRGGCALLFLKYKSQKDEFHSEQIASRKGDKVFWELMAPNCLELTQITLRLLNPTTNSVPAELSFSILNLLHSKLRN
ncbi:hypothetical protein BGZ60DRAFT_421158 [Tricladium varicosporioides]|nr:hypothetical protein BGZ60DRAFT_421158 [Hymenoscyphus varicosporioides]